MRQEETRVVATIFVDRTQIASATGEEEQAARSKLEEALVLAVREAQQRSLSNESVAAFARRARLLGDLA
ncbi:MAG: hypothetical protein JNK05_34875 [Myxococcales bacterium]|nr:hypothetical protein [Myxococcales bacterium]